MFHSAKVFCPPGRAIFGPTIVLGAPTVGDALIHCICMFPAAMYQKKLQLWVVDLAASIINCSAIYVLNHDNLIRLLVYYGLCSGWISDYSGWA